MRGDDGPADSKTHSGSGYFRRVKRLEDPIDAIRFDSRPGVVHRHYNSASLRLLSPDRQLACFVDA
jgi:hypothetical protein